MLVEKRRSKKFFIDYNEYRDRPFGLKWGTAYAMDELVKGIDENKLQALKDNVALQSMTQEEIDAVLSESFLYHKEVEIQLHLKDDFGRLLDNVCGWFSGEAYEDYFVIDEKPIMWEDVRHIEIKQEKKWFDIDIFESKKDSDNQLASLPAEIETIQDFDYQDFYDDTPDFSEDSNEHN
ncbi:hypothetical protein ACYSNU_09155 [Enterococcus sp. LJL120]